jgi:hypothetical protein
MKESKKSVVKKGVDGHNAPAAKQERNSQRDCENPALKASEIAENTLFNQYFRGKRVQFA